MALTAIVSAAVALILYGLGVNGSLSVGLGLLLWVASSVVLLGHIRRWS